MRTIRSAFRGIGALALLTLALSCHSESRAPASASPAAAGAESASPTLYTRLGGEAGVRAVVAQFVANLAADTRINHFFVDTDFDQLKNSLFNLIAQSTGGPQKYSGRDMKTTHAGLGVSGADFDALIEDLRRALDQFKVEEREKGELIALLEPMRKDVVEK